MVFAQSIEARCEVENEDVVGAAPTGEAPTTCEWSTILLPTKVRLILVTLRYMKPYVNLPLATVSGMAGSRLTHVWRVFAVQRKIGE